MEALKVRDQVGNWNDDRLDELARGVKEDFVKVAARFDKVDRELKVGFEKADQKLEKGFAELRAANERLYRVLFGAAVIIIAALVGVPAVAG
jgi:hypothetical protein